MNSDALGMGHEHQHPDGGIPWNKPKVYEYYRLTQNPPWTKPDVDCQIFKLYDKTTTQFSAADRTSIMHYPVPVELTLNGFSVGWNRELSEIDKKFINSTYPTESSVGTGVIQAAAEEIKYTNYQTNKL
jgi:hypothetical protein